MNTIIDPVTKEIYPISSKNGLQLLKKYVTQFQKGGAYGYTDCPYSCLEQQQENRKDIKVIAETLSEVVHKFNKLPEEFMVPDYSSSKKTPKDK